MTVNFPTSGDFTPKTDYKDQIPLNTQERADLKKNTESALSELHDKLKGNYEKQVVTGKVKTFDKGYGLRIRDDAGKRIGTAYKGEEVRIIDRKTGVKVEGQNELKNFLKVQVYKEGGKIDEKRTGWVAEDFIEVDKESLKKIAKKPEKKTEEPKKPEKKTEEPKKPEKKTEEPKKPGMQDFGTGGKPDNSGEGEKPGEGGGSKPTSKPREDEKKGEKKDLWSDLPYGTAISGRPGFVNSPYAAKHQLVDVTGLPVGMEVKCPYSGKLFRVPPQEQTQDKKPAKPTATARQVDEALK